METNLYEVASTMIEALMESSKLKGVDSIDRSPGAVGVEWKTGDESKKWATFTMTRQVFDGPVPKGRPGPSPKGELRYEVTVVATYHAFEDE